MVRKVLLALAVLLGVLLALAAVEMLGAHRQIRRVPVTIPTVAELSAVMVGSGATGPVEIRYVNTATQEGPAASVSHTVPVLRWPDGRLFLIDAGMDRQTAEAFGKTVGLLVDVGPVESYGPVEQQMGDAVQAVKGIGFTHLHSDHTSGITAICAALREPATIFQTVQQATLQNLHTEDGQRLVESSTCNRQIVQGGAVIPVPGFPGLAMIVAGGHTPGSTIFVASVAGETWIFSGDLTNSLAEITEDRDKGLLYSYLLVPENVELLGRWRKWLRAMDGESAHVIVAHDLESYRRNGLQPWQGAP